MHINIHVYTEKPTDNAAALHLNDWNSFILYAAINPKFFGDNVYIDEASIHVVRKLVVLSPADIVPRIFHNLYSLYIVLYTT